MGSREEDGEAEPCGCPEALSHHSDGEAGPWLWWEGSGITAHPANSGSSSSLLRAAVMLMRLSVPEAGSREAPRRQPEPSPSSRLHRTDCCWPPWGPHKLRGPSFLTYGEPLGSPSLSTGGRTGLSRLLCPHTFLNCWSACSTQAGMRRSSPELGPVRGQAQTGAVTCPRPHSHPGQNWPNSPAPRALFLLLHRGEKGWQGEAPGVPGSRLKRHSPEGTLGRTARYRDAWPLWLPPLDCGAHAGCSDPHQEHLVHPQVL